MKNIIIVSCLLFLVGCSQTKMVKDEVIQLKGNNQLLQAIMKYVMTINLTRQKFMVVLVHLVKTLRYLNLSHYLMRSLK